MPAETRPPDNVTKDNLLIGVPFVEFAPALSGGGFGAFRNLGIVNEAAIAKEIETAALRSSHSGTEVLVRELVRRFEARIRVSVFQFSKDNMQLFFASANLTDVNPGSTAVVNEAVTLAADDAEQGPLWADLDNVQVVSPFTSLDPDAIVDEAVGTGDGVANNFSLDFKPLVVADANVGNGIRVGTVSYTAVGVGAAAAGNEVEVVVGTGATSGDLEFHVGGVPTPPPNGDAILADYTPSHTLTENTEYVVDYVDGRIRRVTGEQALRANQPVLADYSYTTLDESTLEPYTQFTFSGKGRVRLLTDVGINIIWEIPSVDLKLTDDDFEFSREEFASGTLELTLVEDTSIAGQPFGQLRFFDEPTANP